MIPALVTRSMTVALLIGLATLPANAHSYVTRSQPANGSIASPPPASISMTFDKPIEAQYAKVSVSVEGSAVDGLAAPQVDPAGTVLVVTLPSPQPGHYKVEWNVVGRDGHRTNGSFGFEAKAK